MRIVFMGTPEFAVPSLRALDRSHEVSAVFTKPDSVSSRGGALVPSPVKVTAEKLGIPVQQPPTLRDEGAQAELGKFAPDVIVVVAYGLILPPEVLRAARIAPVNVHASLLPRWRGAAPIQRAILAGDRVTGVSIMRMEEGLDTGPVCRVAEVEVDEKYADELTSELAEAGAKALMVALDEIERGSCEWAEQPTAGVTYAEKVSKSDIRLDPSLGAVDAVRRVRAATSQASARALVGGKGVTVVRATLAASTSSVARGMTRPTAEGVLLGFDDGAVLMTSLKPDGKREMPAADWARGQHFSADTTWTAAQ